MAIEKIAQQDNKDRSEFFARNLRLFEILDDTRLTGEEEKSRSEAAVNFLARAEHKAGLEENLEHLDSAKQYLEKIDAALIERLADELKEFLKDKIKEGVSGGAERYEGKLESALTPLIKLNFGEAPVRVASEIYYRLIKNHPFIDGNKKIASAFFLEFLENQGRNIDLEILADITIFAARSEARDHERIVRMIADYFTA